jgi:hypothetical protein
MRRRRGSTPAWRPPEPEWQPAKAPPSTAEEGKEIYIYIY